MCVAKISAVCIAFVSLFAGEAFAFEPERARYAAAVEHCRSKPGQLSLKDDKSIFCFDGYLAEERDTLSLGDLNAGGLFVVRSAGGEAYEALIIATLVGALRATVVIYDYCMSACAAFLFIASDDTYVVKDTIVAWHRGLPDYGVCVRFEAVANFGGLKSRTQGLCPHTSEHYDRIRSDLRDRAAPFFHARVKEGKYFGVGAPPQSTYMANDLRSRFKSRGFYPNVFWMWNPRYHAVTLKTRVVYEAYPESQDEVDALIARFYGAQRKRSVILHDS